MCIYESEAPFNERYNLCFYVFKENKKAPDFSLKLLLNFIPLLQFQIPCGRSFQLLVYLVLKLSGH